jgi:hypothetical protein
MASPHPDMGPQIKISHDEIDEEMDIHSAIDLVKQFCEEHDEVSLNSSTSQNDDAEVICHDIYEFQDQLSLLGDNDRSVQDPSETIEVRNNPERIIVKVHSVGGGGLTGER